MGALRMLGVTMTNELSDVSPETTVLVRAQQIVNRSRASSKGIPFAAALDKELASPWDGFMEEDHHRMAVRRVAEAIHAGHGNGFSDRDELFEIACGVMGADQP